MLCILKSEKSRDVGILLIRLVVGFTMFYHGVGKVFGVWGGHGIDGFTHYLTSLNMPLPQVNAWLAALAEFVGGILLMTGTLFRPAALIVSFTMFVAVFSAHFGKGLAGFGGAGGFEFPLNLAIAALGLAMIGSGRFAMKTKFDC